MVSTFWVVIVNHRESLSEHLCIERSVFACTGIIKYSSCYHHYGRSMTSHVLKRVKGNICACVGLHMGPNNLCYVTGHFLFSPYVLHVTFYKTLTSLSTVFIKGHVGLLQLLKWLCRTSFFTHVEPYVCVGGGGGGG